MLSPPFNQAKFVQGGLRQKSTTSPPTLWGVFLCLHLLPSLLLTRYIHRENIPKPLNNHPHRVLTKVHHPPLTLARFCDAYRGCLTPLLTWCPPSSVIWRQAAVSWCDSNFPLSSSYLQLTGIWGYSEFFFLLSLLPATPPSATSTKQKANTKFFQECTNEPEFLTSCWFVF